MLFPFLIVTTILASACASIWPYHEPVGLVPATGAVIKGPSYGVAQGVAVAHASSAATGYNVSPTYLKEYVPTNIAGDTIIAGPTEDSVVIKGPSKASANIIGPSEGSVVIQGPSKGLVSIIGPSEGPVYITGPSTSSAAITGSTTKNIVVSNPPSISPNYVKADAEATAIARTRENAYASALSASRPVIVRGHIGNSRIICPPGWRPISYAASAPATISGSSAGPVALAAPAVPPVVIAGPSGTITTSGSSVWPVTKYWSPVYRKW